jgi:hypothetical protein
LGVKPHAYLQPHPKKNMRSLSVLLSGLLAVSAAVANPSSGHSGRAALIIGVGQYHTPSIPALTGVRADVQSATRMAVAMGIPESNIQVLLDKDATKSNILQALKQLGERTGEGSRALVYFSGHGSRWFDAQRNGCVEGLLSHDGEVIVNEEIANTTSALSQKADKVIVMFDACHSQGVTPTRGQTRNLSEGPFRPKFHLASKSDEANNACASASNIRTRSLLSETSRLGMLQENFVQIASSRPDEVSFDEPGKGGLATQGIRDCLLGKAKDLDGSGAVTLSEIQACAQAFVNRRLGNTPGIQPHHITVTGARNLIPVPAIPLATFVEPTVVVTFPPPVPEPPPAVVEAPEMAPQQPALLPALPPLPPTAPSTQESPPPTIAQTPEASLTEPDPLPPAVLSPQEAALATLRDIQAQSNPLRKVQADLVKSRLVIGQDPLQLRITSSHNGYVYLLLAGSDGKSFYVLFPNGLDSNHRIQANVPLSLPRPSWGIEASGPPGTNRMLVMVSDTPRDTTFISKDVPTADNPFIFSANNPLGRNTLIASLLSGREGSESFAATIIDIEEVAP